MKKYLLFFCLACAMCGASIYCEEIEIESEVMSINPEDEYFIIKGGEDTGIDPGDGLIVHRDAEKIAEAQIIEVREGVSAAEILTIEKDAEIKEGDAVLIVKTTASPEEKPLPEQKKSKWAALLGAGRDKSETYQPAPSDTYVTTRPETSQVIQEEGIIRIIINNNPKAVFTYAMQVLREDGYSVILTNRVIGLISAAKPIRLSLTSELLADAFSAIGHKIVSSVNIKSEGDGSLLTISAFKEHSQKEKQIKSAVTRDSKYYNELVDIASKIKERSEY